MKYQVISPHIDDAVLSMGGLLSQWLEQHICIEILYVFSFSSWVSGSISANAGLQPDAHLVTSLRKKEEAAAQQIIPYSCSYLDYADAAVRKGLQPDAEMIAQLKQKIMAFADPDVWCFFPLGLGHTDHLATRNIGIELLSLGYKIGFYEDMPYMSYQHLRYAVLHDVLHSLGMKSTVAAIDFEVKLNAIRCYRSQVSMEWERAITAYAYSAADNQYYERYWTWSADVPFSLPRIQATLEQMDVGN
ncbi:PIG-L deacetylase family protein [Chitinophaga qingshengii]|uniref:PIG-L family deacetylase n=1 Tax=Chitinophaga qingshengii TaxID=1569794 RepID=A0ABR7TFX1_9BACT|nr:PIG-L family deacetylase [Chitinophaga qingshengii]MBC9929282.1 PIG-L family deacetylase [Chitinophaga qingshengii]